MQPKHRVFTKIKAVKFLKSNVFYTNKKKTQVHQLLYLRRFKLKSTIFHLGAASWGEKRSCELATGPTGSSWQSNNLQGPHTPPPPTPLAFTPEKQQQTTPVLMMSCSHRYPILTWRHVLLLTYLFPTLKPYTCWSHCAITQTDICMKWKNNINLLTPSI